MNRALKIVQEAADGVAEGAKEAAKEFWNHPIETMEKDAKAIAEEAEGLAEEIAALIAENPELWLASNNTTPTEPQPVH